MYIQKTHHFQIITCLALLICGWTAADLVIDLVFEEEEMSVDAQSTGEDPDDAAEHLLMQSPRTDNTAADTQMAIQTQDLAAISISIHMTEQSVLDSDPPPHPPPRTSPISFSVPLRI